jgi:glycosyltransferase involved in cell wall biosynthesis
MDDSIHGRHFRSGALARDTGATSIAARINARRGHATLDREPPEQPIKVLVRIPTLRFGGAEMDLARNLPRIDRRRFKITVCAFLERGSLAHVLTDAGINIVGPLLPAPRSSAPAQFRIVFALLRSMKSAFMRSQVLRAIGIYLSSGLLYLRLACTVAAYIRAENIDVVHAILPNSYVIGAIATAFAGRAKLVLSRVSLNWYHEHLPLLGFLERHVFHRALNAAICNSRVIRQELLTEGIPADKIRLIQNGIDVEAFSRAGIDRVEARKQVGISNEALVFSSVANFYVYKGHADLLKALSLAFDRLPPNWMLLAVGVDIDGYMDKMRRLSEKLGLASKVCFLGPRNDVELILHAADIHVSASHTEGLPNNVLEAMCANLPVVATAVGGVPDMVIDGQTGILVPAKSPQKMAHALIELANDPCRRRSMGEAGRSFARSSFTLERTVSALEEVYAGCRIVAVRSVGIFS